MPRISTGLIVSAVLLAPNAASAAEARVTVEVPRISASTYRKPYVAVWIEDANGKQVRTLKVFYDQHKVGARWLPELKTWWRRGGRAMDLPADGLSSPTRAPGRYTISADALERLAPGKYSIAVEASREEGGRELVKVPFTWRPGARSSASASGKRELGRISVSITP